MAKYPSRPGRWAAAIEAARMAVTELEEIKDEYQEWRDNLPDNLEMTPVAEKLDLVGDLDLESINDTLEEAENLELPRGFGRD